MMVFWLIVWLVVLVLRLGMPYLEALEFITSVEEPILRVDFGGLILLVVGGGIVMAAAFLVAAASSSTTSTTT